MANIVAIVGRPNVGKSTLFNRITESRKAIVDEQSGVTRDRHHGHANWSGREFTIIDTGGYISGSEDVFEGEIRKQVEISIQEANIILFVVDVTAGITDLDDVVADMLRKSGKKVFVIANKVDNNERWGESAVFHSFGLGAPYNISSLSGSGTGDLLDAVIAEFHDGDEEELDIPKFAIVGRPNVGKSSLVNALIGKEKNIVTDIAGTTRDALGTRYNAYGFDFMLTDTAGLRKKGKVDEDVEFYSVMRSIRAIENSDVCILLIEADKGVMAQDLNILQLALKNKKGLVIMVNKWDLIADKGSNTIRDFRKNCTF